MSRSKDEQIKSLQSSIFHLTESLRAAKQECQDMSKLVLAYEGLLLDLLPEDTDPVDYFFHEDYLEAFGCFEEEE